jgi:putative mRNA 3-end processing factor
MGLVRRDIELAPQGMRLRGYPLWLDATKRQELSFVSHAHADHIARHQRVIATAPTLALMAHRLGRLEAPEPTAYRAPFELGPLQLELFPAGHVLGSAQLRVTREGRRVVYTGDLNAGESLTAEPAEVAECDTLVIESTFGHPRYRFPPRAEVFGLLQRFVERCFERGQTPVVLGYSLGKAQEAVMALGRAGFSLCAHSSIVEICDLYRAHGIELPPLRRFDGTVNEREVLLFPPNLRRSGQLNRVRQPRTTMLTGWALDPPGRSFYTGVHELLPLSDHADFPTLMQYALSTGAKQVFTVHGFCRELAEALRERGVDARPLEEPAQLELF